MAVLDFEAVQNVAHQLGSLAQSIGQTNIHIRAQCSALQQAVPLAHVGAEEQLQQAQQQLTNVEHLLKAAQQHLTQLADEAGRTEADIQPS